jgi:hypothetical protein
LQDRGEANHAGIDLLCSLDHPNIPKAIEFFEEGDFPTSFAPICRAIPLSMDRGTRVGVGARGRELHHSIMRYPRISSCAHPAVIHRISNRECYTDPSGTVYLIDLILLASSIPPQ